MGSPEVVRRTPPAAVGPFADLPVDPLDLEALPASFSRAPAMWPPHALRPRVMEIFLDLIEAATGSVESEIETQVGWHRLLKISGQLLLRVPGKADPADNKMSHLSQNGYG